MPFIHFKISEASGWKKHYCEVDGHITNFKDGDIIEVGEGMHVVSFESGMTRWNVQETIHGDECLNILIAVGMAPGSAYNTVLGAPQYAVGELDETTVLFTRKIHEIEEHKSNVKSANKGIAIAVLLILHGIAMILVGSSVAGNDFEIIMIFAAIGLVLAVPGVLLFMHMKKKKKEAKAALKAMGAKIK